MVDVGLTTSCLHLGTHIFVPVVKKVPGSPVKAVVPLPRGYLRGTGGLWG